MEKEKKNGVVITIMGVIIVILVVLCVLFATGIIEFNRNELNDNNSNNIIDNQDDNTFNENSETNDIVSKKVDNLNNSNSEISFNEINVSIKQNLDNEVCVITELNVNGEDIKSNVNGQCVESYAIFENNVIFLISGTSFKGLYIYNTVSKLIEFNSLLKINDYKVNSYSINNNEIIINAIGCGAQCGVSNDNEVAEFEIIYSNGSFSEPVKINS